LTSRDPEYITPRIKAMLRRRNRLTRTGRVEEAGALSVRIGQAIERRCRTQLSRYNGKTDVGSMWAAVRRLTGRQQPPARVDGITAETLNEYYARVSSDPQYVAPTCKPTTTEAEVPPQSVSEWEVFRMLDTLRPTAAGLDGLPAWFLRVAAPVICKLTAHIFNMSLSTSTVPRQWKEARIQPIPKVAAPVQHSDFRPISVTPILTRMMERVVVREYLYPSFHTPPPSLTFLDQYAFRPTGSTTAAVISLFHTITTLLQSNPFVIVISLDFSKAFDTVRHSTLLAKMAELELPVAVYNWLVDFFREHAHRTMFNGELSSTASISASIIQGSGIGPAAFTVTAADLKPLHPGNSLVKFADDTYLVVPSVNAGTRQQEMDNIATWAAANNLKLNVSKSKEIIFRNSRRRIAVTPPQPLPDISRENVLKILGVTITNHLSASEHIRRVIGDSAQSLYALRVLRHHGMTEIGLHAVFRAVVVSRLTYASPAWSGFTTATDRQRVDAFLSRSKRRGFCPPDLPSFDQLLEEADDQLFERILNNPHHTLYQLLPPQSAASQNYNLRRRTHDRQLLEHQGHLSDCNFITRLLYKNSY